MKIKLIVWIWLLLSCAPKRHQESKEDHGTNLVQATDTFKLAVDSFPILSAQKIALTRAYAHKYYGTTAHTIDPKIIVIHYTAIPTLKQTLDYFKPDSLDRSRINIIKKSALNVGIHYVVDKDGTIHHLLPDSIMARHIIGFNHVALGIENVAYDSTDLTLAQLMSNARLIKFLATRHPEIRYLIGHSEYGDQALPHYKLIRINDPTYVPYDKPDPGNAFLSELRKLLKEEYGLEFQK